MRDRLLLAATIASLNGAWQPVVAQGPAATDCARSLAEGATVDPAWAALRPSAVRTRLEPVRVAARWSAAVDSLRAFYLDVHGGSVSPEARAHLNRELLAFRTELAAGDDDHSARSRGRVTLSRFQIAFRSELDGGPAWILFPATTPVVIDSTTPAPERRTLCWLAFAASDLAAQFGGPGREALATALEARVRRWDAFTRHGYSMLPHELLLNGLTPRRALEPPQWQIIALHASAGVQLMSAGGGWLTGLERRDLLLIEPIGFLRYSADRDHYLGLSMVLGMPAGVGAALHVGRLGRLAFLARAEGTDGRRGGALMLSSDVYRYLGARRDQLEQLRERGVSRCLADATRCVPSTPPPRE